MPILRMIFTTPLLSNIFHLARVLNLTSRNFRTFSPRAFQDGLEQHIKNLCAEHSKHDNFMGYIFSDIPRWYFYEGQELDAQAIHPWVSDLLNATNSAGYQAAQKALGKSVAENRADSDRVLAAVVTGGIDCTAISLLNVMIRVALFLAINCIAPIATAMVRVNTSPVCRCHLHSVVCPAADQQHAVLRRNTRAPGCPSLMAIVHLVAHNVLSKQRLKVIHVASKSAMGRPTPIILIRFSSWPFMLGWHHCGIMEQWDGAKMRDWEINENGFLNPFEEPYEPCLSSITAANKRVQRHPL